jgi:uroporphyrin-III C-methyltransferase
MIVENASLADERRVLTTLAGLGEASRGLEGPALLVIGEVVALASAGDVAAIAALAREARS